MTPFEIVSLRKAHGLHQTHLARLVGVSPQTISYIERGQRTPSDTLLVALKCVLTHSPPRLTDRERRTKYGRTRIKKGEAQ